MQPRFRFSSLLQFLSKERLTIRFPSHVEDFMIDGFSELAHTKPGSLTWMKQKEAAWKEITAAVVICPLDAEPPEYQTPLYIKTENPRLLFTKLLNEFAVEPYVPKVDKTAIIHDTADVAEGVSIGPYCEIGRNVKIESGTTIHSHVKIYPNTTIKKNCIIHSGSVLGGDGFGYERNENNIPLKIQHLGGLVIHENVEIGNHTCIDRGTLSHTVIGEHTKISNQCNISHNVVIGKQVMICAKACVNGSTRIEDNVWISPGAILNNGLRIGEDCTIGSGAVVINDVEPLDVVAGVPARSIKKTN